MLTPIPAPCADLVIAPFLHATFALFCQAPPSVAHWTQDGTAVVIHDLHRFAADVLPHHFGHSNLVVFVRQLHSFGFRNFHSDTQSSWEFFHTHFILDEPERLCYIQRDASVDEHGLTPLQCEMNDIVDQVSQLTALVTSLTQERRCCLAKEATNGIESFANEDLELLEEVLEILELPQQPLTVVPTASWDY
ncbi:hypothetical protein ACHHYP_07320 [Achlya hypogyna]|uniref:HSF-type DNA-binding domain-containing protein n=1 Tax=Achlya hypogyna TaxID=1202772 RepID=A0A1V9YR48_ACHHY|nr:hypothetical protein ACHHYP_07320 [Achlya hypogyna]